MKINMTLRKKTSGVQNSSFRFTIGEWFAQDKFYILSYRLFFQTLLQICCDHVFITLRLMESTENKKKEEDLTFHISNNVIITHFFSDFDLSQVEKLIGILAPIKCDIFLHKIFASASFSFSLININLRGL